MVANFFLKFPMGAARLAEPEAEDGCFPSFVALRRLRSCTRRYATRLIDGRGAVLRRSAVGDESGDGIVEGADFSAWVGATRRGLGAGDAVDFFVEGFLRYTFSGESGRDGKGVEARARLADSMQGSTLHSPAI